MTRKVLILLATVIFIGLPALALFMGYRLSRGSGGLPPGTDLPAAMLETLDGREVETSSWSGSPTVLVLFKAGCLACEVEIRGLIELAEALPNVRVVLVSLNSRAPSFEVPFEVYVDPAGDFIQKTHRMIVPTLYWIDAGGKVVHVRSGMSGAGDEIQLTRRLLAIDR